ncbi:hypothetical protein MD484_g8838, partial [Candolleomyces efflorescens]
MGPKRKIVEDTDNADEFKYPSALVPSVKDTAWNSPTKAAKRYHLPFERRSKPVPPKKKHQAKGQQARDDGGSRETGGPSDDVDGWPDVMADFAESSWSPASSSEDGIPAPKVEQYLSAVEACVAGLFHIGALVFVVEGWDINRGQSTGAWYHLQYLAVSDDDIRIACTCPQALQDGCIHQEFFRIYTVKHLQLDDARNGTEPLPARVRRAGLSTTLNEPQSSVCPSCPSARRQYIGPDLREQGLFNYNNSILVSHELLDEYTMAFVASETPFTAFVSVLSHRYTVSGVTFMGEDLFRSIWFSYVSLQAFDDDFKCSRCGPYPDTVIWDGITLAFSKKHLSATLAPPTQITPQSLIRKHVKNYPKQQLIPDVRLRKDLREVSKVPSLDRMLVNTDSEGEMDEEEHDQSIVRVEEHLDRVQRVYAGLAAECTALGSLFLDAYGAVAFSERRPVPPEYRNFFTQIAAEESILQLINGSSLNDLLVFLSNPVSSKLTRIISIPAVYSLIAKQPVIEPLLPLLHYLADKSSTMLKNLTTEGPGIEAGDICIFETPADWKLVSYVPLMSWRI